MYGENPEFIKDIFREIFQIHRYDSSRANPNRGGQYMTVVWIR